ncbi:haloacid dehalogenase superfamily, subfamily IA, variant 3 with third motif having DD or ED [Arthrobacter sp. ok909]|uniref:HAD family hydrolase n=1 Tax=Arthrobacter sp. ok909 TaxID=1761746 RepID=UPI00087E76A8|nr:HAD family hydrolase [Arthrobacter sp. ok909]SDP20061.1 haloacid dehalogenase superfamily, subfamily IA, variant 3 with third motif having DD or ED [Arthrobacter sp. ok909]
MTSEHGFELVVFDCDGVLVDSEVIAVRVDQRVLADLSWDLELDEIVERFVGRSEAQFVASVEQHLGIRLADGWDQEYGRWYQDAFERGLEAVDGIEEALDRLRLPHCVASSGSHEKMHRTLGKTGLLYRFQGRLFSATDVANGKPAPDLFLHAARRLSTAPERCAVVEDSAYGVQAARAAGMHVFAYAGGVTPAARLAGPGTTVFSDMRQLPGLIAAGRPA